MKYKVLLPVALITPMVGLIVANVYGAWAVTDKASAFGVRVGMGTVPHEVTFHVPDSSDEDCLDFTTSTVDVNFGETIPSNQIPSTASFLNFNFVNWYTDAEYTNSINISTYQVSDDVDLYAKFTRSNILMDDNLKYYTSSNSTVDVDAYGVYKIGTQTWGTTPIKVEADRVNLTTASGKYVFTYANSAWTMKRVVALNLASSMRTGSDSWVNEWCVIRPWLCAATDSSADTWGDVITFDSNGDAEIKIDVKYAEMVLARLNKNDQTWSGKWQQSKDIWFNGDDYGNPKRKYTKDSPRCYVWGSDFSFSWGAY